MGADKGWPERTIGQQKEVEITAHFRMQSDECLGERGEGVGQDICHEHFASGPRIEQLVYAPECWTSLTPGNCSAKTSCNFSL